MCVGNKKMLLSKAKLIKFKVSFWVFVLIIFLSIKVNTTNVNAISCYNSQHLSSSNCIVNETKDFIWPKKKEVTAPAPTSFKTNWYIGRNLDGNEVILLNITWCQHLLHFKRHVVGYILSVSLPGSINGGSKSHVSFRNKSLLLNQFHFTSRKVCFVYDDFGWTNSEEFIFPGFDYVLKIQALPLYFVNSDPELTWTYVNIPTCEDEKAQINTTINCLKDDSNLNKKKPHYTFTKEETSTVTSVIVQTDQQKFKNIAIIIVFIVVFFFLFCFICLIILAKKKWRKKKFNEFKPQEQLLMFINNTSGEDGRSPFDEIASRLATLLRNYGGVDICCNLWEKSQIFDNRLWLQKRLSHVDHLIFFLSPSSGTSVITLQDLEALHRTHSVPTEIKRSPKVRITLVSCKRIEEKTKCSRFQIMEQFKEFFESATGRQVRNVPLSAVEELTELIAKAQNSFQ